MGRDPAEEQGGLNLYGFCRNNSINLWDLLGMANWIGGNDPYYDQYGTLSGGYYLVVGPEDNEQQLPGLFATYSAAEAALWDYNMAAACSPNIDWDGIAAQNQAVTDWSAVLGGATTWNNPSTVSNGAVQVGTPTVVSTNAASVKVGSTSLTWNDFKGTVPAGTQFSAAISTGLKTSSYTTATVPLGNDQYEISLVGASVAAVLNTSLSWVKPNVLSQGDGGIALLQHEGGHLAITVQAGTQLQAQLSALSVTVNGANINQGIQAVTAYANQIIGNFYTTLGNMQSGYDSITNHGANSAQQNDYNQQFGVVPGP